MQVKTFAVNANNYLFPLFVMQNHRITFNLRKGKKMIKKWINKWMMSKAYNEYCLNIARLYNYHTM